MRKAGGVLDRCKRPAQRVARVGRLAHDFCSSAGNAVSGFATTIASSPARPRRLERPGHERLAGEKRRRLVVAEPLAPATGEHRRDRPLAHAIPCSVALQSLTMPASGLVEIEDARSMVLDHVRALPAESVALGEALGRVLAEDIEAEAPVPASTARLWTASRSAPRT